MLDVENGEFELESLEVGVFADLLKGPSEDSPRELLRLLRLSSLRASRATARLPCLGLARIRAMPAPLGPGLVYRMIIEHGCAHRLQVE